MSSKILRLFKPASTAYVATLTWCSNYFVAKTHALPTGLERGEWYDVDTQLLHGMMTALVDFVEVEQAWMHAICDEEIYATLPWWVKFGPTRAFIKWRSSAIGLQRLEWERNLRYAEDGHTHDDNGKLSGQALAAQAQLELYTWWKERQVRPDPYDLGNKPTKALLKAKYPHIKKIYPGEKAWSMLQRAYNEEETAALHRLIDIRGHLWT